MTITADEQTQEIGTSPEVEQLREMIERLRNSLVEANDLLAEARDDHQQALRKHEEFRTQVARVASRYAIKHDWCSVVREALDELGLRWQPPAYAVTLQVEWVTTVQADDEDEAIRRARYAFNEVDVDRPGQNHVLDVSVGDLEVLDTVETEFVDD